MGEVLGDRMTMVENCQNCAFKVDVPMHQWTKHECHRHAPQSFTVYKGHYDGAKQYGPGPYWPDVKDNDFCGDWELTDARS
jgi:hypothetical protein